MQRSRRLGSQPKHLEKMLFINHKEDLMLDDRLTDLHLRSRQRVIEMDLDRNRVKKEWRNSRKKNMTLNEAIAAGILPAEPITLDDMTRRPTATGAGLFSRQGSVASVGQTSRPGSQGGQGTVATRRPVASAPPRKMRGGPQSPMSRSKTFFREPRGGRESIVNSFQKQPSIPENEESTSSIIVPSESVVRRRDSVDTVGTYVLDEFEKVSQVVPDILRALAKKKEKYEEEMANAQIAFSLKSKTNEKMNLIDYEPDMNKIRKTVGSVKKLRHRMAISKRLEVTQPKKSFDQLVKDKRESIMENEAFSDGISALMKRKLERKRRDSSAGTGPPDGESAGRRHSLAVPSGTSLPRRMSGSLPDLAPRRASMFPTSNPMSRGGGLAGAGGGFGSPGKLGSSETSGGLIDEDELINRQRINMQLGKYQLLQGKVDSFLKQRRPGSRAGRPALLEQVTSIT